jgi:hypothetical protein
MNNLKDQLSKKETKMFQELGFQKLFVLDDVITLYRLSVEKAFCENSTGPAVESLRRCYTALRDCSINRMTPEWENLIQLSEPEGRKITDHLVDSYVLRLVQEADLMVETDGKKYKTMTAILKDFSDSILERGE